MNIYGEKQRFIVKTTRSSTHATHARQQHHGETTETSQARLSPGTGPVNIWLQQTEILTTQPVKLSADVVAYFFCGVYQHPSAVSSTDLLYV